MNCLSFNHSALRNVERLDAELLFPVLSVGSRQSGVALLTGLIFLIILTLLGITAMQTSIMEERMSGNTRDRNIAFQAAEAALRDAELDIQCKKIDGSAATVKRAIGCISGMLGADLACTAGLCCVINDPALVCIEPSTPVYKNTSLSLSTVPSVKYGFYTGAPEISGIPSQQQPRYLIEPFQKQLVNYYRITARGYGVNSNTQVTLQEVYKE